MAGKVDLPIWKVWPYVRASAGTLLGIFDWNQAPGAGTTGLGWAKGGRRPEVQGFGGYSRIKPSENIPRDHCQIDLDRYEPGSFLFGSERSVLRTAQNLYNMSQELYNMRQMLYNMSQELYNMSQNLYNMSQMLYNMSQMLYNMSQMLYNMS